MAAMFADYKVAPENLRMMLLAFGVDHAYRVISLEEVAHEIPHVPKDLIRGGLEQLAEEGLITRFAKRYCFNKPLPAGLRQQVEQLVTPSGTVRLPKEG
jgi:predicted transcriptional regulator of viral defense system